MFIEVCGLVVDTPPVSEFIDFKTGGFDALEIFSWFISEMPESIFTDVGITSN